MQVRLEVTNGKSNVRRVLLERDAVIGRAKTCNLRVASNQVSREHCKLLMHPQGVVICDMGSSNGTVVNGERIPANQELLLESGSEIIIGPARFRIVFDAPPKSNLPGEPGSTVDAAPAADLSTNVNIEDTVQAPPEEEVMPDFNFESETVPEAIEDPQTVVPSEVVAEVVEDQIDLEEDLELDSPDDSVKLQEADLTAYEDIPGRIADAPPEVSADEIPDFSALEAESLEAEVESEPIVEVEAEPVAEVEVEPIVEAEIEVAPIVEAEPIAEVELEAEPVAEIEVEPEPAPAPPAEAKPAKRVKKIKKVKKKETEPEAPATMPPATAAESAEDDALGFLNDLEGDDSPKEADTGLGDFFSQFD